MKCFKKAIECFQIHEEEVCDAIDETTKNMSFTEKALRKREICKKTSEYMDTRFVFPTANIVERLFSKADYSLELRRGQISPQT